MFLAGAPFGDELAAIAANGAAGVVLVDARARVDVGGNRTASGRSVRLLACPESPAARASALRAALGDAAIVVTADPALVLEAAVAAVPSVIVAWGAAARRWTRPQVAFVEGLPGTFACRTPAMLAPCMDDALAFAADGALVSALRVHAAATVYTDVYPAADRIADAVDALTGRPGARHHYLRDPILDVESKQNVVGATLLGSVAVAARSFDATMIDSEES
jgi:hypothetical protein